MWIYVQPILEFRKSFRKYQPVFPQNPKKILWTPFTKIIFVFFSLLEHRRLVEPGKRKDSKLCDNPYQNSIELTLSAITKIKTKIFFFKNI